MPEIQPHEAPVLPRRDDVESPRDGDLPHVAATGSAHVEAPRHSAVEPRNDADPAPVEAPRHSAPAIQDEPVSAGLDIISPAPVATENPALLTAEAPAPAAPESPTPITGDDEILRARRLQLRGRESKVFGPVDLTLTRGGITVVTGQQGAGRSALLLALSGRLKGVQGELQSAEIDGIAHPRKLRRQVSVARISDLADLEPNLTIAESRDERAIADGIGVRRGRERFAELETLLNHQFDKEQWVGRMPAVERTLLTIVLGCLAPASFVVLDDVDDSLTERQLTWIHDGLGLLTEQGHSFVLSSLEQSPVPPRAQVVHLSPPPTRTEPNFELHRLRRRLAQPTSTNPTTEELD
ncbi:MULTISPECIES: ATP-binding cassette domain-containing protein [unclassified Luteococcus]|uniref:ATP-binding cassette domain-containing protein n=1 Tax=unclassified Luteococcus TaxID=2639923 RepID=UPI00313B9438